MAAGAGADKVLTTNASGIATWQTAAGGEDTWITTQTCGTDYALQSVGKTTKTCINKIDYSDIAYDLSCTDCIGPTEITDSYVLNTGDAMTGALAMGNQKITGLATPTVATDAATKGYADAAGGGGMYTTWLYKCASTQGDWPPVLYAPACLSGDTDWGETIMYESATSRTKRYDCSSFPSTGVQVGTATGYYTRAKWAYRICSK